MTKSKKIRFKNDAGIELEGVLEQPEGEIVHYALYAHCFTCSKTIKAAVQVSRALAARGIATLRFDFSGLGGSGGDFANTTFSSDIADIKAAYGFMERKFNTPKLLIGHSLGGAAVLAAAGDLADIKAVATIGAPSSPAHVAHLFKAEIDKIKRDGKAKVMLGGRKVEITQKFLDDIKNYDLTDKVKKMNKALLILHAPNDKIVGINNATEIYKAAKHPKSFITLDGADHLLSKKSDADYAANIIAAWSSKYIGISATKKASLPKVKAGEVVVEETGDNKFSRIINANGHEIKADEPISVGGTNTGAAPYDLLLASLGACTSMTVRMYADHKGWDLKKIHVRLSHNKDKVTKQDNIEKIISFEGKLTDEQRARLMEIAERCPVNRTLKSDILISSKEEILPKTVAPKP